MNLRARSLVLVCALLSLTGPGAHAGDRHALLVGVSHYPTLNSRRQLPGARNDVDMMRAVLGRAGFGAGDIAVLAHALPGARTPTRLAILGALERLGRLAAPGKFIYLHFSGHGSQQPAAPGELAGETDGLDEIFLPADIGSWDGSAGVVRNAIVDQEFKQAIARMRARGATVWAVFDTCHAGTMSRSGEEGTRELAPGALGIPSELLKKHRRLASARTGFPAPAGRRRETAERGGLAVFYAAQSDQTTLEERFPDENGKPYGVFSYALAQALSAWPGASYRQLGERILTRYAAQNRYFPTPLFEGEMLDRPVFGGPALPPPQQWPVEHDKVAGTLSIAAGTLNQFGEGAVFAVAPAAAGGAGSAPVYLKATQVDILRSTLLPLGGDAAPDIKPGASARLVDPGLALSLRVAAPERPTGTLRAALARLRSAPAGGVPIIFRGAGQRADVALAARGAKIWLIPQGSRGAGPGREGGLSVPVGRDGKILAARLYERLERIAKIQNLLKLAAQMPLGAAGDKRTLSMQVRAAGSTQRFSVAKAEPARLRAGDRAYFRFDNGGTRSVDLTLLFLDSNFGIAPVFPYNSGEINRIEPGGHVEVAIDITSGTLGRERVLAIAVEAAPFSLVADFSFLAQRGAPADAPERNGDPDRDAAAGLHALLANAGFGAPHARGAGAPASWPRAAMAWYGWTTLARANP
ncbi:caspase family protein [Massilia glaciei]|uniref:caspase family protein n=1 Tax=Massilia glaciei TaxID=1524097 RepID=UPI0015E80024|nr:caspase family protein [Massilia glaciei]